MSERRAKEMRRKAREEGREPPPGRPLTLSDLKFPRYLKGGQTFSDDGALNQWEVLWAVIIDQPWWPELRDRLHIGGTRSEDGWLTADGKFKPHRPLVVQEVFLAWIAFYLSDTINLKKWVKSTSEKSMWQALGLDDRPNYWTVYRAFRKLYPLLGALRDYTDELARAIVAKVPDFMVDVAIDGTEWAVAAQLYHDCDPETDECPLGKAGENLGKYAKGPLHNMTSEQAAAMRAEAIDAGEDSIVGAHDAIGDASDRVAGDVREAYRIQRKTGNGVRWYLRIKTSAGHWFLIRDVGAGIRMYERRGGHVINSWVGRHLITSTCKTTGLCGAGVAPSASRNEPDFYDELLETGERATGWPTLTLSTDKAGSRGDFTEHQTRAGRLHISPLLNHMTLRGRPSVERNRYNVVLRTRRDRRVVIDQDDRLRCETCGLPTRQTFIEPSDGSTPFVKATCMTHLACKPSEYTITIAPLRLLPIPRHDPRYMIRKFLHGPSERQHGILRSRNDVAAKAKAAAPRQALESRATAELHTAIFLDHLRYALRNRCITPPAGVVIELADIDEVTYEERVEKLVNEMRDRRRRYRLDRPFGTKLAEQLGGTFDPPAPLVIPTTRAGP